MIVGIVDTTPEQELRFSSIHKAWESRDYPMIQSIAHKMQSSAIYCGTLRMKQAYEALEHHFKLEQSTNPEDLYHQFRSICEQALKSVRDWLTYSS